jgi:hypothetical protein
MSLRLNGPNCGPAIRQSKWTWSVWPRSLNGPNCGPAIRHIENGTGLMNIGLNGPNCGPAIRPVKGEANFEQEVSTGLTAAPQSDRRLGNPHGCWREWRGSGATVSSVCYTLQNWRETAIFLNKSTPGVVLLLVNLQRTVQLLDAAWVRAAYLDDPERLVPGAGGLALPADAGTASGAAGVKQDAVFFDVDDGLQAGPQALAFVST